jgi:hypothetical protein
MPLCAKPTIILGTQLLQDVIGMENQASMRHRVLDPARKNVARSLDGYEDDESAINSHRDILVMVFGKPDSTRKAVSREITGQLLLQCNGRPEKYCNFPRSCRSPLRHVEHYPVVRYANWIRTPVPLAMSVDVGRAEEVRRVLTTFAVEVWLLALLFDSADAAWCSILLWKVCRHSSDILLN